VRFFVQPLTEPSRKVHCDRVLEYSLKKGNDHPKLNWDFPGLKAGDKWCLCVSRWKEAEKANVV
jgi:uncharacterized protein (DUF2237 family)